MAKTCVLSLDSGGVTRAGSRRQVRFTVTVTTTANDAGADNGETITTTLGGTSKTITTATVSATQTTLKQALGLPNQIDFITAVTPMADSQTAPAVAYIPWISLTSAKCVLIGASATAGQLQDNTTVAIPTGTYTAQFIAQGY